MADAGAAGREEQADKARSEASATVVGIGFKGPSGGDALLSPDPKDPDSLEAMKPLHALAALLALAAAFLSPDEGRVLVDGVDLATVELASYRSQLGLVLQDDFLFEGTIRDNLLFARPGASAGEVEEAARRAHVMEFAERLEDGLDTLIGERGVLQIGFDITIILFYRI